MRSDRISHGQSRAHAFAERPFVSPSLFRPTHRLARRNAYAICPLTDYPNAEFVVVTSTELIEKLPYISRIRRRSGSVRRLRCALQFLRKMQCRRASSDGERVIFLNDDVEAGQRDWIENLIEPLENPQVGADPPKLLYPTGRIQHAGLVTGGTRIGRDGDCINGRATRWITQISRNPCARFRRYRRRVSPCGARISLR